MAVPVTIVGCGAVAQRLYRQPLMRLERRGLLRVVALVDPVLQHSAAMRRHFPSSETFDDLDRALARPPALVLVLSPAHLHCAHTLSALRHDCHVLCEKPMASTEEECRRMNALARERRRVLAIGMIRRFFPAYAELRNLLLDDSLGRLESFEFREGRRFDWDVTTSAAFRPRAQGGTGVLFDIGPHVLDALSWMLGELRMVHYSDDALTGVESNARFEVAAASCEGTIHLSWDSPQSNELRVFGDRGEAVLRTDRFDQLAMKRQRGFEPCSIASSFAADLLPVPRRRISPRSYADAIYCQIVQVLRALTLGELPAADGSEGQHCVSLLESALSIARPLPMPWLDEADQRAYEEMHWSNSP